MATLPTNYQDDIMNASMNGKRRYTFEQNSDGTYSLVDVTTYDQIGSDFGAAQINAITTEVNAKLDSSKVVDPANATEAGYAADAAATGTALAELNSNTIKSINFTWFGESTEGIDIEIAWLADILPNDCSEIVGISVVRWYGASNHDDGHVRISMDYNRIFARPTLTQTNVTIVGYILYKTA